MYILFSCICKNEAIYYEQNENDRGHKCATQSVTRLGDLLHFGQLCKACDNNYFAQIAHILRQFLERCQNLSFFQWNHF